MLVLVRRACPSSCACRTRCLHSSQDHRRLRVLRTFVREHLRGWPWAQSAERSAKGRGQALGWSSADGEMTATSPLDLGTRSRGRALRQGCGLPCAARVLRARSRLELCKHDEGAQGHPENSPDRIPGIGPCNPFGEKLRNGRQCGKVAEHIRTRPQLGQMTKPRSVTPRPRPRTTAKLIS